MKEGTAEEKAKAVALLCDPGQHPSHLFPHVSRQTRPATPLRESNEILTVAMFIEKLEIYTQQCEIEQIIHHKPYQEIL